MLKEIFHFFLHLRLHYQFLILSGGYLLGGFIAGQMDPCQYWLQFLNVHILLFGGATAYNSFWDKDKGPVGGLKHPPEMTDWMHPASLILMFAGFLFSFTVSPLFAAVYFFSLCLFWLYSTPHARWKGHPIRSLLVIGLSTGVASVLLGNLAAGGEITLPVLMSSAGAAFILLSLYPVSQIFQLEEDKQRNDFTFSVVYGMSGVKIFFIIAYTFGSTLLAGSLLWVELWAAIILFVGTLCSGIFIASYIFWMTGDKNEYEIVMKTKFFASLSFVCFFLIGNSIQYGWFG